MLQQFDHAYHAVHRGADFVAHGRQKLAFGGVGRFGGNFGFV
jgi:hypothetical protein